MTALVSKYQSEYSVEERCAACDQVRCEFPDCVPIVAEQLGARQGKSHFLALPREATVKQLQAAVRRTLELSSETPLALAIGDCTPSATTLVGNLYDHCRQDDGFLYVMYVLEASMGSYQLGADASALTGVPQNSLGLPLNGIPVAVPGIGADFGVTGSFGLGGGAFCL